MTDDAPPPATAPYTRLVILRNSVAPGALPDNLAVGDLLPADLFGRPAAGPGQVVAADTATVTVQWGTAPAAPAHPAPEPHQ